MLTELEYKALIKEVNRLRDEVNLFSNEEISESALDDLKHKISEWEKLNPTKISPNSPNYNISGGVAKGFEKFQHARRMLSLTDVFRLEELQDWQEKWENYLEKEAEENEKLKNNNEKLSPKYIVEPKMDGLAVSLIYENGLLVAGSTRGDGWVGELITENIKQISNIPKEINDKRKIEVRGEVFMTKSDFESLNKEILEEKKVGKMAKTGGEGVFTNPRNVAAGTLRQLDSRIVSERNLTFLAYNVFVEGLNG